MKREYVTPEMEILEVSIENGFAQSNPQALQQTMWVNEWEKENF